MRIMREWVRLNSASHFYPSVSLIAESEDATKSVGRQVSDFQQSQSRWLMSGRPHMSMQSCRPIASSCLRSCPCSIPPLLSALVSLEVCFPIIIYRTGHYPSAYFNRSDPSGDMATHLVQSPFQHRFGIFVKRR
jgi:hypothetical protein